MESSLTLSDGCHDQACSIGYADGVGDRPPRDADALSGSTFQDGDKVSWRCFSIGLLPIEPSDIDVGQIEERMRQALRECGVSLEFFEAVPGLPVPSGTGCFGPSGHSSPAMFEDAPEVQGEFLPSASAPVSDAYARVRFAGL